MLDDILRYARAGEDSRQRANELLARAKSLCPPRHVLRVMKLDWSADQPSLGGVMLPGRLAQTMLRGCQSAAILVCTLGYGFEREAQALRYRDAADLLLFDAAGSALVEQGCDQAEEELARQVKPLCLTDRFSPGYGDLPLTLQHDLLRLTDARARLGVIAHESAMLSPQKTVTALIGLADSPRPARIRGCAYCGLREHCPYRSRGETCSL